MKICRCTRHFRWDVSWVLLHLDHPQPDSCPIGPVGLQFGKIFTSNGSINEHSHRRTYSMQANKIRPKRVVEIIGIVFVGFQTPNFLRTAAVGRMMNLCPWNLRSKAIRTSTAHYLICPCQYLPCGLKYVWWLAVNRVNSLTSTHFICEVNCAVEN